MHVLWLASWYPNKTDPFNGDFIQRHATAVSSRCRLTVVHVVKDPEAWAACQTEITRSGDGSLTENICYFRPPRTPFAFINRILSPLKSFKLYARAINQYIAANGRPEFIHVHVCMNAGMVALWAKWRWKIPYLVTEHFTGYIPGSDEDFYSRPLIYRRLNRLILRKAMGVHTVSRFLGTCVNLITPISNPIVIPNVVNTALFKWKPPISGLSSIPGLPIPGLSTISRQDRPFRFIHVSSFQSFKNVRGILEAFALLRQRRVDWQLVLAGPAPEDLRSYGEALNLSGHLLWTGALPYADISASMQTADALVQFSRYETQGCVILEALATGLPVVSSEVGGVPEIIGREDGQLIPSEDTEALALALEKLMMEYGAYDRSAIAARAEAAYCYETVSRQFMAYYALVSPSDTTGPWGVSR